MQQNRLFKAKEVLVDMELNDQVVTLPKLETFFKKSMTFMNLSDRTKNNPVWDEFKDRVNNQKLLKAQDIADELKIVVDKYHPELKAIISHCIHLRFDTCRIVELCHYC